VPSSLTGTSYVSFAPSVFTNYGGDVWDGLVPGRDASDPNSPDAGILVTQPRNLITGTKGYKGTNVTLAQDVANTTVILAGALSGATDPAVLDNSNNVTNVYFDHVLRSHRWGGAWTQGEMLSTEGGAGPMIKDATNPANGAVWLDNAGARVQAVGGTQIVTADAITFRTPDLARFQNSRHGEVFQLVAGWPLMLYARVRSVPG
jgi:hypothetical protein